MANNPVILSSNVFHSDKETELSRAVTEKWLEYILIMEKSREICISPENEKS